MGQSHRLHCEKDPAEAVLPSPAEEVQPATGAAEICLSCHHWISPLHINNCLVQFSYQIWPQWTTEGSLDCWANHWYNPPYSPITVFIQSDQNGWQNHSRPLTSSTLPLWTVTIWSTLQSSEYQNNQTQEQFLPSSNPSHEHLRISMGHTLFIHLYTYLSNTHTQSTLQLHIIYMYIQNCPLLYTCKYNWQFVYYSLFTCYFESLFLLFVFFVLSLSFCCTAVASVTKTNSSYVWTYLAIKLILILIHSENL